MNIKYDLKTFLLFFLLMASIMTDTFDTKAQVYMDTIRLNQNNAATLNFNSNETVVLCNIGGNPFRMVGDFCDYKHYQISMMDNIVLIEAKQVKYEPSSIMVKTDKAVYHGTIMFDGDENISKNFYDYSSQTVVPLSVTKNPAVGEDGAIQNAETDDESVSHGIVDNGVEVFMKYNEEVTEDVMFERLAKVMKMENEYEEIADMKGEVIFQVADIVNDHKYSYLKLVIQNNSSTTYRVNGVFFCFRESKKSSVGKKDAQNVEWIPAERIKYPSNRNIPAYSHDIVGFVIPLYNGSTGTVMLKVIEEQGTRTAVLNIKSKLINNCKVF